MLETNVRTILVCHATNSLRNLSWVLKTRNAHCYVLFGLGSTSTDKPIACKWVLPFLPLCGRKEMGFIWNFSIGYNPLTRLFRRFGGIKRVIASNALLGFRRDVGAMPASSKRVNDIWDSPYTFEINTLAKETVIPLFSCWFSADSENQLLCKGDLLFVLHSWE